MLVNFIQNNTTFTGTTISRAKIKQVQNGITSLIDVAITRLKPEIKDDLSIVSAIGGKYFYPGVQDMSFYAIELPGKSLTSRILGLAEVHAEENGDYLEYIQTKSPFRHKNDERTLKGIGNVLFSAVCHIAGKKKDNSLSLTSIDNDFYFKLLERAGITHNYNDYDIYISLDNAQCKRLAGQCEQDYNFSFLC